MILQCNINLYAKIRKKIEKCKNTKENRESMIFMIYLTQIIPYFRQL